MAEPVTVDVRPGTDSAFTVGAKLDGVSIRFRFRWMPRLGLWFCLMAAPDGTALSIQQAVRPNGLIRFDVRDERAPSGRLIWIGPEGYRKADLGELLQLVYVPNG